MSEIKQTVTQTEDRGVDQDGAAVKQQTRQVHTETSAGTQTTVRNAIWYIAGFIEVALALRFVLKLTGANPQSGFVSFVYAISGALSAPFNTIFGTASAPTTGTVQSVFEPSILVAMAVYALIAWGIAKLVMLNRAR